MGKVIILTDSTVDISEEMIKERDIRTCPLGISIDGKDYKDGVDLDASSLYEIIERVDQLPKTSACSVGDFLEIIEGLLEDGNEVIYTGIGSKLSSAYQNALIAKDSLDDQYKDKFFVIDSMSLSSGIGLTVLKMCDLRDQGLSAKEIAKKASEIPSCVRAQFSVKDLTFLHKGGRCSGTKKFFGTMLRIRPILRMFNGELILSDVVYGRYDKALDYQIDDLVNNIDDIDKDYLFITHSMADEEAKYMFEHIPENILKQFKHVYQTKAGCVISSHCGKNTIGILYIKKSKLTSDK